MAGHSMTLEMAMMLEMAMVRTGGPDHHHFRINTGCCRETGSNGYLSESSQYSRRQYRYPYIAVRCYRGNKPPGDKEDSRRRRSGRTRTALRIRRA